MGPRCNSSGCSVRCKARIITCKLRLSRHFVVEPAADLLWPWQLPRMVDGTFVRCAARLVQAERCVASACSRLWPLHMVRRGKLAHTASKPAETLLVIMHPANMHAALMRLRLDMKTLIAQPPRGNPHVSFTIMRKMRTTATHARTHTASRGGARRWVERSESIKGELCGESYVRMRVIGLPSKRASCAKWNANTNRSQSLPSLLPAASTLERASGVPLFRARRAGCTRGE